MPYKINKHPFAHVRVGELVFGQATGSLAMEAVVPTETMAAVPPGMCPAAAATTPTVFLTAMACLETVRRGQHVLVQAITGGLGQALTQVAALAGARVSGTAGGPSKRAWARRRLGLGSLLDSRGLGFASDLAVADAHTPDVIVNSLTSPGMVAASLAVLAHAGNWVEVGKRDIWSCARVRQERPDVEVATVAVDFLPGSAIKPKLTRLAALLSQGAMVTSG